MAIRQGVCKSFKLELFQAIHDLEDDVIKVALYSDTASLSSDTTAYTATGEVSGSGYSAGGAVSEVTLTQSGQSVEAVFATPTWPASTITARGALIYNSSKSNAAIAVLNFGDDRSSNNTTFSVTMPAAGGDYPVLKFA